MTVAVLLSYLHHRYSKGIRVNLYADPDFEELLDSFDNYNEAYKSYGMCKIDCFTAGDYSLEIAIIDKPIVYRIVEEEYLDLT